MVGIYHSMSHLLDPATIPEQSQDLIQQWTLRDLMLATATTEDTIKFLAKHKLLANSSTCVRLTTCGSAQIINAEVKSQFGMAVFSLRASYP